MMIKSKPIYIFLLLISIQISVSAQFKMSTETAYLNHINAQGNKALIENNIPNAELMVDQLLKHIDISPDISASIFLYELSISYYKIEQPAQAMHRLMLQRCLFPNDSISKLSKSLFYESCYQNKFNHSFSDFLWTKSSEENLTESYQENILILTELSTQMHLKELQPYILQLGNQMQLMNMTIPAWYEQWEFLVRIRLKEKHIVQVINYDEKEQGIPLIDSVKNEKIRIKIYRKSIKHYIRTNSFVHAKEIVVAYQKENQNWFESFDLQIKKLRIWIGW